MSLNVELLRASFQLVAERMPNLTERFYEILFVRYPQSKGLFDPSRLNRQKNMLKLALIAVMEHLEDADWLTKTLRALGAKHVQYGVTDRMYGWVGDSLLATLKEAAASDWTPELEEAWSGAYLAIATLMQERAHSAQLSAPTTERSAQAAPAST
jgi:hemoglobin-like flavoprotein